MGMTSQDDSTWSGLVDAAAEKYIQNTPSARAVCFRLQAGSPTKADRRAARAERKKMREALRATAEKDWGMPGKALLLLLSIASFGCPPPWNMVLSLIKAAVEARFGGDD